MTVFIPNPAIAAQVHCFPSRTLAAIERETGLRAEYTTRGVLRVIVLAGELRDKAKLSNLSNDGFTKGPAYWWE